MCDDNGNFSDEFEIYECSENEYPTNDYLNSFLSKDNENPKDLLFKSNNENFNILQTENHLQSNETKRYISSNQQNIIFSNLPSSNSIIQNYAQKQENIKISKASCCSKQRNYLLKNLKKKKKPVKRKRAELTQKALEFKEKYYLVFTKLKKFPERFVVGIHNLFLREYLNVNQVERYQYRSINNYFQYYSEFSDEILKYLMINKGVIQFYFPELINNGWKKK